MTVTAMPGLSAPVIRKPNGELLATATIHEGLEWLEPTGLFESFNCIATDSQAVWPCPANTLAAPVQAAATVQTSGGTLPQGAYRAVVTAVNARGETVASNEITASTANAVSRITWNWAAVSGATSYNVYMTQVNGPSNSEVLAGNTTSTSLQISAAPTGSQRPPTSNGAVVSATKTFNPVAWNDGVRFAVYAGATCKGPGVWGADEASLREAFLTSESVGVERGLMQLRLTSATSPTRDITPAGGAVDPTVGLAMLEGDAACHYAGVPTIHAPVPIVTLLSRNGAIHAEGDQITDVYGSKIVAGGGYGCPNYGPNGSVYSTAGEYYVYASGEVVIARGDVVSSQQIDRSTNDILSLVERPYVAAVDCYVAAIKVKVA